MGPIILVSRKGLPYKGKVEQEGRGVRTNIGNEIRNDVAHKVEHLLENLKMLQALTKDSW